MTGRAGYRTMEMNGGSSAPYLARTPCVPLFVHCFIRVGTEGLLDYQGRAGDHFHCTVEPSPGHIRCRKKLLHNRSAPMVVIFSLKALPPCPTSPPPPVPASESLAHRNRSNFCDLRLRCPSRTPEIAAISETRESNAALRFKGAMESR